MNSNINFSPQELEAMHSNHKIKAIKLVRESKGLGLKKAKDLVDDYMSQNSHLIQNRPSSGGFQFFVFLILLVLVIWYFMFSSS